MFLARGNLKCFFFFFSGSLCALPADNGPCLSEIQDALSPAKKTSITQACSNYLSDLQTSCSIRTASSNFDECTNICGKLKCWRWLLFNALLFLAFHVVLRSTRSTLQHADLIFSSALTKLVRLWQHPSTISSCLSLISLWKEYIQVVFVCLFVVVCFLFFCFFIFFNIMLLLRFSKVAVKRLFYVPCSLRVYFRN